jgi:hypothetical protein
MIPRGLIHLITAGGLFLVAGPPSPFSAEDGAWSRGPNSLG